MRQLKPLAYARACALAAAALLLAGCATAPRPQATGAAAPAAHAQAARRDPLEGVNRGLYRLGDALDRAIVRPIVSGYRRIAPRPVRRAVHNVVQNLDEPVVFANDVLQLHPKAAAVTAVRFFANSTVGVAGVFDAASTAGLPHHDNGFGSTLGRYGVAPGPYMYVPILGPTTLRDAFGDGVDFALDPFSWTKFGGAQTFGVARTGFDLLDRREQAEEDLRRLHATAADPYATLRSVYLQSREAEIKGGEAPMEALPELPEAASSEPAPPGEPAPPPAPQTTPEPAPAPAPQTSP